MSSNIGKVMLLDVTRDDILMKCAQFLVKSKLLTYVSQALCVALKTRYTTKSQI